MRTCLPQDDPHPGRRYRRIARQLDTYKWEVEGPLAMLEHLPAKDRFGLGYGLKRFFTASRFALNIGAVRVSQLIWPHRTMADYRRYYPLIRQPPRVMKRWRGDKLFAQQRLAGANPLDVVCLSELPPDFDISDPVFRSIAGDGMSLDRALGERRLFYVDHSDFDDVAVRVEARGGERFLTAPKTLYWLPPEGKVLAPVAIQLRPTPGADNPVFTPADPHADWLAAKIYAQCGDTTSHEMVHHLAQTHFILEPVAVATVRQLAPNHPVRRLLDQHLEYTLTINDFGRRTLVNPGGFLDQLMAGWLHETLGLVGRGVAGYRWDRHEYWADLKARNLLDADMGADFPWRDDGQLVWQAIRDFVGGFVALYYPSSAEVVEDGELARWLAELKDPGLCKGLVDRLETPEQVAELLTQIVWISGPKHAAVNYAQWDYAGYVPNMPFALWGPAPREKGRFQTEKDIVDILPPRDATLKQILLMEALTGWQHTTLGVYGRNAFKDPRVDPLVATFRAELARIDGVVDERNAQREIPNPYLKPSLIPNSTNT